MIRKCLTVKSSLQGMQNGACSFFKKIRMSNSSVSNSTSDDFCLFFSAVIRECAFAVKIWFYFI